MLRQNNGHHVEFFVTMSTYFPDLISDFSSPKNNINLVLMQTDKHKIRSFIN